MVIDTFRTRVISAAVLASIFIYLRAFLRITTEEKPFENDTSPLFVITSIYHLAVRIRMEVLVNILSSSLSSRKIK